MHEMNVEGARLARQAADEAGGRFVAGSVGPLNVTLSLSPKVDDPAFRAFTFDEVAEAYAEQIRGLARGRRRPAPDRDDLRHAEREGGDRGRARGRARSCRSGSRSRSSTSPGARCPGQTVEAFWIVGRAREAADRRRQLLARGEGDAAARRRARPDRRDRTRAAHPNAGLPNAFGGYDERPHDTAALLRAFAEDGFVNVVGGCCGTTPDHVRKVAAAVAGPVPATRPGTPLGRRASAASSRSRSARTRAS